MRHERLHADATLLLVSILWGSAFVAQRIAAPTVSIFIFNGLRFLLGGLVLLPFAWYRHRLNFRQLLTDPKTAGGVVLAGLLLWGGAALQQAGMRYTTAGNAGFITGLYVVIIPLLVALGPRQKPGPRIWAAAFLGATGLYLLSTGGSLALNPGDALELVGAFLWALHVILIGWLVQRLNVLDLAIGQYMVCGLASLLTGLAIEQNPWLGLSSAWGSIAYTGILSVGLGYTLQAAGQRVAPPADAAIILSSEAVFAALFGWLILGETLTPLQLLGCGIMFSGMLLAQVDVLRR